MSMPAAPFPLRVRGLNAAFFLWECCLPRRPSWGPVPRSPCQAGSVSISLSTRAIPTKFAGRHRRYSPPLFQVSLLHKTGKTPENSAIPASTPQERKGGGISPHLPPKIKNPIQHRQASRQLFRQAGLAQLVRYVPTCLVRAIPPLSGAVRRGQSPRDERLHNAEAGVCSPTCLNEMGGA